jgi:hypothetical protein
MSEQPTEENFTQQLHTRFRVRVDAPRPLELELELVDVKGWRTGSAEQQGMERFSVYFTGPADPFLPQGIYTLEHEQMGVSELFLVPIEQNASGFRYEAVFNYFK